jgi:hypothetical protein
MKKSEKLEAFEIEAFAIINQAGIPNIKISQFGDYIVFTQDFSKIKVDIQVLTVHKNSIPMLTKVLLNQF